jgi:hypothetical protein
MVIQAGEDLAAPTVGECQPADDVHLPQLHRAAAFPAPEAAVTATPGTRVDQVGTLQGPIDARARRRGLHTGPRCLVHETPRSPVGVSTTALEHPHLDRGIHLVGTPRRPVRSVRKAREAVGLIPPEPAVDRLARDAEAPCNLHDRDPVADHREHRLIPLLHDTQLHQHARECVADQAEPASPIRRSRVTHQPKPERDESGGTKHSLVGRAGLEPATDGL